MVYPPDLPDRRVLPRRASLWNSVPLRQKRSACQPSISRKPYNLLKFWRGLAESERQEFFSVLGLRDFLGHASPYTYDAITFRKPALTLVKFPPLCLTTPAVSFKMMWAKKKRTLLRSHLPSGSFLMSVATLRSSIESALAGRRSEDH